MANPRDQKFDELIAGLSKKQVKQRRAPQPANKAALFGAAILIGVGIAYIAYQALFTEDTKDGELPTASEIAASAAANANPGGSGSVAEVRGTGAVALEGLVRPPDLLSSIFVNVPIPAFVPAVELMTKRDDKPRRYYVLLNAKLDDFTEKLWSQAGMFETEGVPLSPFVRTVTIVSAEAFTNLIDWHVDGVAVVPATVAPTAVP